MGAITPDRLFLILRVLLGLAILGVGIGSFAEYIGHVDLDPSHKRPIGASAPIGPSTSPSPRSGSACSS